MNQLMKKKMSQVSKKKRKGFTLVELIIVIAIIAILAAIAIPKFGAARHQADVSSDQANAKIIATALATAVSNGDIDADTSVASVDATVYQKYIDGGKAPKGRTGDFAVSYDKDNGITVKAGSATVYPVD